MSLPDGESQMSEQYTLLNKIKAQGTTNTLEQKHNGKHYARVNTAPIKKTAIIPN
jgi:hypothetical protein